MAYVIEFKSRMYPYSYEFERTSNGAMKSYRSIIDARKKCISLINQNVAILGVIRGLGDKEELVYTTVEGGFVLEQRTTTNSHWYRLYKNGNIGTPIRNINNIGLVQSSRAMW